MQKLFNPEDIVLRGNVTAEQAESVKVPFLLQYPARYGNEKISVDAPINTPDILPTLLAMADLPISTSIEGEDMTHFN